jgi:P-type Ca2+ transporter type 2B
MEPFEDNILKILIVAAIVQLIIGIVQHGAAGMVDGVSIFLAIAIITFVTAGNNYVKEKQFQELQKKTGREHLPGNPFWNTINRQHRGTRCW